MGQGTLVESDISDSIALIKFLDDQDDQVSSAFWHYFTDAEEWRLLIAGQTFDTLLPMQEAQAYQLVVEALTASHAASLTIADIKLVRTDHSLVEATRRIVGTSRDGLVRAHFTDTTADGIFIKEMLVLRSS